MKENVTSGSHATPMLFPYEPEQFWQSICQIIREEVTQAENSDRIHHPGKLQA